MKKAKKENNGDSNDEALLLGLASDEIEIALMSDEDDEDDRKDED